MTAANALPCSPAAERNKQAILDVLRGLLPPRATVLEVASGTGQHAQHCAAAQAGWRWQPSEAQPAALHAIAARCAGLPNVQPPLQLDVLDVLDVPDLQDMPGDASVGAGTPPAWPANAHFDAVFCANLLHIAPWAACAGLARLAAQVLQPGGLLVVYGPFLEAGVDTAPGNLAFDADLQARCAAWGLRQLADVAKTAAAAGLQLAQRVAMPANNLVLVFRAAGGS